MPAQTPLAGYKSHKNHEIWFEETEIIYFSSFFELISSTVLQDRCKSQIYLKKYALNGWIAKENFKI